jgi:hypothetical protein
VSRRSVAAVLAALALAAGCGGDPESATPPAAETVAAAQRAIGDARVGHVTVHQLGRVPVGQLVADWDGDYDLRRRLWNALVTAEASGDAARSVFVGTARGTYASPADAAGGPAGRWTGLDAAHYGSGTQPHVAAVLAFRPGGAMRREPDGWSVEGTVPMPVALAAVGVRRGWTPGRQALLDATRGTAHAKLLLGPDHRIRELRMYGSTFEVTSLLSRDTRDALAAASVSIRVSRVGTPVSLRVAPPEKDVDAEQPVSAGSTE